MGRMASTDNNECACYLRGSGVCAAPRVESMNEVLGLGPDVGGCKLESSSSGGVVGGVVGRRGGRVHGFAL